MSAFTLAGSFGEAPLGDKKQPAEKAPALVLLEGDKEILQGEKYEEEVNLSQVPEGCDAVLEFTAWYQHTVPAGFYSSLRVYWGSEELQDILDRPTIIRWGEGRESDVRNENGWLTAILNTPEQAAAAGGYQVPSEDGDITHYRFLIPPSSEGKHRVKIANTLRDPDGRYFSTLMLRDVRVIFLAK